MFYDFMLINSSIFIMQNRICALALHAHIIYFHLKCKFDNSFDGYYVRILNFKWLNQTI